MYVSKMQVEVSQQHTMGIKNRPALLPANPFNAAQDATALKDAMKGLGTDEKKITNILAHRTSDQRQEIVKKYDLAYSKDLLKELKNELGGTFEAVIVAMMTPLPIYLARELNDALKGKKKEFNVIVEILCTRSNADIKAITHAYQNEYKHPLEDDLKGATTGVFERLLISIASANRHESHFGHIPENPVDLAHKLHEAVESELGTNEAEINRILSTYPFSVLHQVYIEYKKKYGKTIGESFDCHLSDDIKIPMKSLNFCMENRFGFIAKALFDSMKGSGCRNEDLIRIVVSRCELDFINIKEEYIAMYGKGPDDVECLEKAIKGDTKGDYRTIVLSLIDPSDD